MVRHQRIGSNFVLFLSVSNLPDGYANSVANRTTFPTSGGFISINSEHPSWTRTCIMQN